MLTHLYRLAGAALVIAAAACGSTPNDHEGADNTDKNTEDGACDRLRVCCSNLGEDGQSSCLSGAAGGAPADCTAALQQHRASGACR